MAPLRRTGDTPPVTIDVGPAYEMLMSLVTFTEISNHAVAEVGAEWLAAAEKRAGPRLAKRVAEFSQGSGDGFVHLLPLVYDSPAPRDVDTFTAHLEAFDATEITLQLLGYHDYHVRRMTPPEKLRSAVEGDADAAREVLASCESWPGWQPFVERVLRMGPRRAKRELLSIVRDWSVRVWPPEQEQLLPILKRDAEAKRLLARELPFERFFEVATNGVRWVSQPEAQRLVLVPSYLNRPWVSYAEWRGAAIVVYPVADESVAAESDAPPLRLIRLTKALADEKRLRILRALAEKPRSLIELAEQFDVPKTSMHHHMVTLRSAGLVSVTTGARDKEYRLRNDVLPGMSAMLAGYIASSSRSEPEPEPAAPAVPVPPSGGRVKPRPGQARPRRAQPTRTAR